MKTLKSPARLVACISTVLASWLALAALVHVGSKFPLHEAAIKGNFIEMIVHSDTELGLNERDFDGSMARLSRSNLQGLSESLNPHTVWSGLTGLVGSNKGWTALMYAAAYGHSSVIENMVAAGANVNLVDRDGNSALMIAIQTAQPEVATSLIALGADLQQKNTNGENAFTLAIVSNLPVVMGAILEEASDGCNVYVMQAITGPKVANLIRQNQTVMAKC